MDQETINRHFATANINHNKDQAFFLFAWGILIFLLGVITGLLNSGITRYYFVLPVALAIFFIGWGFKTLRKNKMLLAELV